MLRRLSRSFFIALSRAGWAQRTITGWGFAWRAASRFIAGETLEEALRVIRDLNERGINATLDHLGENTTNPEEARLAADEVIHALRGMDASHARANVSIKLSQLGLTLDEDLCRENLRRILTEARALHTFVRIDMEDSTLTERTLQAYYWACQQGFENTGIVIQSYLYRSEADLREIEKRGGRVRLCKGAYQEPPAVAFPKKQDVDANYDHLAAMLMESAIKAGVPEISSDGRLPPIPALATHDDERILAAQTQARFFGLPKGAVEFQMLYGIRRDLQDSLVAQGFPVRVYVPYGTRWYPYFMRRLAERPANVWFFLSNYFRR